MSAVAVQPRATGPTGAARRAHVVPRLGTARVVLAAAFVIVVAAVALQAQLVAGQGSVEGLMGAQAEALETGADLRAAVAFAESPADVLAAAEEMGMVRPSAAVALPATPVEELDPAPPTDAGGTR